MPTTWGLKVQELLREQGRSAAWLAKTAKISRGTITNWLNNPNGVQPEPEMIGRVARAFGKTARELAPYGGYPVLPSEDGEQRNARVDSINPRETKIFDDLRRLSPRDQDTALSMIETWITMKRGEATEPGSQ